MRSARLFRVSARISRGVRPPSAPGTPGASTGHDSYWADQYGVGIYGVVHRWGARPLRQASITGAASTTTLHIDRPSCTRPNIASVRICCTHKVGCYHFAPRRTRPICCSFEKLNISYCFKMLNLQASRCRGRHRGAVAKPRLAARVVVMSGSSGVELREAGAAPGSPVSAGSGVQGPSHGGDASPLSAARKSVLDRTADRKKSVSLILHSGLLERCFRAGCQVWTLADKNTCQRAITKRLLVPRCSPLPRNHVAKRAVLSFTYPYNHLRGRGSAGIWNQVRLGPPR